ncbi:MAG: DUF6268 family outer membrane beta-barrel protein [Cyclobacteriaceae bacterium]
MRNLNLVAFIALLTSGFQAECQSDKASSMVPDKWINFRHSTSPGQQFSYNGEKWNAAAEDIYAKIWLPVLLKEKYKLIVGPYYRAEQIEFEGATHEELACIDHWNLRSAGIDSKLQVKLGEQRSLLFGVNFSQAASTENLSLKSTKIGYTATALYRKRFSTNEELGFGVIYGNNLSGITILPIILWNKTFNDRYGVELAAPYKLAMRYNASDKDIFHLKSEGDSRNYLVPNGTDLNRYSRVDLRMGLSYTRLINRWIGVEVFSGYRRNLRSELPNGITLKKNSGLATSVELFVIPAFKKGK